MRSLRSRMLASMMLFLPHGAQADPQPLMAQIVEESFDPIWPVSGHVIVGVMGHLGLQPQPNLLLFVGPQQDIRICAEITSRSRNYRASLAISETALASPVGFVRVLDMTGDRDALARLAGPDLAVRATPGACGAPASPGTATLFIAGWGDQAEFSGGEGAGLPDEVRLMVNARTSSAAVLVRGPGDALQNRLCDREENPRRSGFDFTCMISLREAKAAGLDTLAVEVHRANFGAREEPVRLVLQLYRMGNE